VFARFPWLEVFLCACAARRPISLRKEMGERTAKGSILWNPLNHGGLRGLLADGRRGAVICGLYRECGAVALCVNTRIVTFRCRPAVQTGGAVSPVAANAACPVRARTCNHTFARFAGGAVHTRIGAFRCRTAVRGEGVPVTNSFDFRSELLRLFVQCCFVTKTRCLVINASR
jgi:hypothetical protein